MLPLERVVRELFRPSESNPTYGLWWWLLGRRASRSRRRGSSRTTSAREAEYWATDAGERRTRAARARAREIARHGCPLDAHRPGHGRRRRQATPVCHPVVGPGHCPPRPPARRSTVHRRGLPRRALRGRI